MSRVEDDRQAQRTAERLVQEKRLQESKGKQRQEGESSFSKLVQQQKSAQAQQPPQQNLGKSVLARLQQEGKAGDLRGQQRQTGMSEGQVSGGRQSESPQMAQAKKQDQGVTQTRVESRAADAKDTSKALDERGEALDKDSESAAMGVQARREGKGSLKADADGGGKGGGEGKDKKDGAEAAASFRFNPALMAPVPVAKPNPASGSERLRAIANEIAQKIVERVRVGTNAAGNAEFQIDLRNDVLKGLSIKLSAKNGKIHATFSGSDREVLKMLEGQRETLKNALAGRGLTLEELRVEAKS
ncbi:flagellar hook-length control protein FliK [Archangium sp. Cb G35]|uniref:flagellar hook-length control protein FliK n=1 Tax=Archangium sp. Cb G35 TaxID=1920190 RepID=UPI000935ADCF|nr:flagellar hook-length control protein FliK [Archangium sp. Cb G35]OJT23337.1 flagellar hook-length control protein FliK [Archangium sp. Cb G35]